MTAMSYMYSNVVIDRMQPRKHRPFAVMSGKYLVLVLALLVLSSPVVLVVLMLLRASPKQWQGRNKTKECDQVC